MGVPMVINAVMNNAELTPLTLENEEKLANGTVESNEQVSLFSAPKPRKETNRKKIIKGVKKISKKVINELSYPSGMSNESNENDSRKETIKEVKQITTH